MFATPPTASERSRLREALWWLAGALLLPLLLLQERRTRLRTPRLPEAQGATTGTTGAGRALRLAVVGESPVAGVGVATYEEALAAQLARCLARRLERAVAWTALGENGADAAGVLARLAPRVPPCDVALIVMGVNDTTRFTGLRRWRARMADLITAVQARCIGPVVVAGVPPMGRFSALPQPLRAWVGLRAALLDGEVARVAAERAVLYAPVPALVEPRHLARDGYHPSVDGCAAWAELLADRIADRIAAQRTSTPDG